MFVDLDNHDRRIRYFELLLERDLDDLPQYELPAGYHFEFYHPGDRDNWIAIEQSAKEILSYEKGIKVWDDYYGTHEQELPDRMVFVVNEGGEKIATATAYYDVMGNDNSGDGWLHWVAVKREYQGKGISKPLIAFTLNRLLNWDIPTQRSRRRLIPGWPVKYISILVFARFPKMLLRAGMDGGLSSD